VLCSLTTQRWWHTLMTARDLCFISLHLIISWYIFCNFIIILICRRMRVSLLHCLVELDCPSNIYCTGWSKSLCATVDYSTYVRCTERLLDHPVYCAEQKYSRFWLQIDVILFRRVRIIARKRLLASSCPSVRPHGTTLLPLEGLSWNFVCGHFFEKKKLSRKFKFR
jgi:hypothetical protein